MGIADHAFFSFWRQQWSVSLTLLLIYFIAFLFFVFYLVPQHSCSPGSRPQQDTITPTSCTPWKTRVRPSSAIISRPSRCKSSLGQTWQEDCRQGNRLFLSLTQLTLEVRPLSYWHLPQQAGESVVVCRLCACEVVATFSRRPEANDRHKFRRLICYWDWGCKW